MKHVGIWGILPVILVCALAAVMLRAKEEPEQWPFRSPPRELTSIRQQSSTIERFQTATPVGLRDDGHRAIDQRDAGDHDNRDHDNRDHDVGLREGVFRSSTRTIVEPPLWQHHVSRAATNSAAASPTSNGAHSNWANASRTNANAANAAENAIQARPVAARSPTTQQVARAQTRATTTAANGVRRWNSHAPRAAGHSLAFTLRQTAAQQAEPPIRQPSGPADNQTILPHVDSSIPSGIGHTIQPHEFDLSPAIPASRMPIPDDGLASHSFGHLAAATDCIPSFEHGITTSHHLAPYLNRAAAYPETEPFPRLDGETPRLPNGFEPWWNYKIRSPLWANATSLPVNVDELVIKALEHSPQVLAAKAEPEIVRTSILEEQGEFDWHVFLESTYDHNTDPVGNTLTTGGANRFRDHVWSMRGGVRRTNELGGKIEASQKGGYQDNNSRFFVPNQQGTARLELSYTQPLLNGNGRAYNQSRIMLAQVDTRIAEDDLAVQLQDHLLKVTESYWELYRARSLHLQKHKLLGSAMTILKTLEARQAVDSQQRQVLRARAAVASRRSEIARAVSSIRNAESKLRYLVNDPRLTNAGHVELIPHEVPRPQYIPLSMSDSLNTAIINRPDITQAIRRMKATCMQLNVARNEVLPTLDLVMSTYVAGLSGNSDFARATSRQFVDGGEPGYSIGLFFEVPLGNRTARARQERRQWEVRKALREFEATVEGGITKVELSFRELETSYREMLSRFQAMAAAANETEYLHERWKLLPRNDRSTIQLLEEFLDSQERLADEEADFTKAQVNYALALADLKRSMGTLLSVSIPTPITTEGERPKDGVIDPLPHTESAPDLSPPILRVP